MKTTTLTLLLGLLVSGAQALDLNRMVEPETLFAHREALAFTPEQEERLEDIYESAKAEAGPLGEKMRETEGRLESLLRSADLDPAEAETGFASLLETESKLKQLQFRTLLALRAVLTPEQLEKAVALGNRDKSENAPRVAALQGKAMRLKDAFDELELRPSPALEAKGERIGELIRSGDYAAAETALDELGKEVGIDEPVEETVVDFSQEAPGATDLPSLEARYAAVEAAVRQVHHLPTLRLLLQGRDALEAAKATEDAEAAGRVLTWAENLLGVTSAP